MNFTDIISEMEHLKLSDISLKSDFVHFREKVICSIGAIVSIVLEILRIKTTFLRILSKMKKHYRD